MAGPCVCALKHVFRVPVYCLAVISLLLGSLVPVWAATLDVTVTGVRNDAGTVMVAVCTAADFLSDHCSAVGSAAAKRGSVAVRVQDIAPGTYAVQVFHDENGNRKIDRNFLGIPTEGMAFSNDARFHFGPPRFEDAAVKIGEGGGRVTVTMRYF